MHALIVHEARHAEGYPHTCALTAEYGYIRDKSVTEMGAFGAQYLLGYWLGHYSDETEEVRQFARRNATLMRNEGSFCCECGGRDKYRLRATFMKDLFAPPGQNTAAYGATTSGAGQP